MGSAPFLIGMTVFIAVWFIINAIREFDTDFFVLNLIFSTMASYAAPLILLAQNRTAARDRIMIDLDRSTARQSATDMAYLTAQITQLRTSLVDLPDRDDIRDEARELRDDLRTLVHRRRGITPAR